MTAAATRRGVIMGTAAYMSPEQARGKVVDWRTDVWAFGCVLYEMLAGQQLFSGDTLTDVLAAIVTKAPDWTLLPRATPASVRTVLRRCLTGDLKRRAQHVGDVRIEIDEALQGRYNGTDPVFVPATASPGGGMRWAAGLGIAGVVLGALDRERGLLVPLGSATRDDPVAGSRRSYASRGSGDAPHLFPDPRHVSRWWSNRVPRGYCRRGATALLTRPGHRHRGAAAGGHAGRTGPLLCPRDRDWQVGVLGRTCRCSSPPGSRLASRCPREDLNRTGFVGGLFP